MGRALGAGVSTRVALYTHTRDFFFFFLMHLVFRDTPWETHTQRERERLREREKIKGAF